MAVADFDRARRSLKERLDAAERKIDELIKLVASQQTLLVAHDEVFRLWLKQAAAFKTIAEDMLDKERRLAALEGAERERSAQAGGVGSGPVSGTAAGEGVRLSPAAAAARLMQLAEPPTDLPLR